MSLIAPVRTAGEQTLLDRLATRPPAAAEAARAVIAASGLPTRRVEAFKWSDLRAALSDGLPEPAGAHPVVPHAIAALSPLVLSFRADGIGVEGAPPAGLDVAVEDGGATTAEGLVAALAAALAPKRLVLTVTQALDRPIVLLRGPGAPMRIAVEVAGKGAVTLIEVIAADAGLSTGLIEAQVASGGVLTRISLQRGGAAAVELGHADIALAAGASYAAAGLALGARFARAESFIALNGAGASCRIDGAYLLGGAAHADATLKVEHAGAGGTTSELFKGAVRDRARGVFQGKIVVAKDAQHTDARQNHHALMLNEGCEIDAKPELEIWADDVQCAHGNTIGALDDNALFYARARGIPDAEARAMLTDAFIAEAFDRIEDETVRAWLHGVAQDWLGTQL
jgi:Fe-S cluster assembly protein SufD